MKLTGRILWLTDDTKALEQQLAGTNPGFDPADPLPGVGKIICRPRDALFLRSDATRKQKISLRAHKINRTDA